MSSKIRNDIFSYFNCWNASVHCNLQAKGLYPSVSMKKSAWVLPLSACLFLVFFRHSVTNWRNELNENENNASLPLLILRYSIITSNLTNDMQTSVSFLLDILQIFRRWGADRRENMIQNKIYNALMTLPFAHDHMTALRYQFANSIVNRHVTIFFRYSDLVNRNLSLPPHKT
jgi:hypothetical protein